MYTSNVFQKKSTKYSFPQIDPETQRLHRLGLWIHWHEADIPPDELLRSKGLATLFSVEILCAAIQNNCTVQAIKGYLQTYTQNPVYNTTLSDIGWPLLYYAAERNSAELVSILQQHGVKSDSLKNTFSIPLIAYVAIHGHREAIDTSEVMKLLLASGADPKVIPMDMWIQYLEAPQDVPNSSISVPGAALEISNWCTPTIRPVLARSLHLTHRYLLCLAHNIPPLRPRMLQIAIANKMVNLTKLPYFLVGQRPATNVVMKKVYSHIAHKTATPLVMAFAGASGHGKTELARSMGELLSVNTVTIDCTGCRDTWALFGSTAGWARSEDGSQLNNFLADNNGKRSVVFLDEFDKTEQSVREALLLVLQSGEYEDRRNRNGVDCTQTIWIVATNFGDDHISKYYTKHIEKLSETQRDNVNLKRLQASLLQKYGHKFGTAFTGRIHLVVPFLPFTPPECAVVLHKFLLEYATSILQPIDCNPGVTRLIGHCRLSIVDDGKVCTTLTEKYYNKDLGARSLDNAVREVKDELCDKYTNLDGEVTEDLNDGPLQAFTVRRVPVADDIYEVGMFADGTGEEEDGSLTEEE